jgi:DNA-binding transcriptional LysR family regulator
MDKDQFDGLLTLKTVAQTKNFSRAAEVLGISHSSVSQIIKALEVRLGVTLISRSTRSINLTEAGEQFLAQTDSAMDQILNSITQIASMSKKPSGLLRLNIPIIAYYGILEPVIFSFLKKYPEVSIEVTFQDKPLDVVKGGYDAAVRLSNIIEKDMVAIKIFGPINWVVVGTPKYFNKAGRPKHPKELLNHNCFRFAFGDNLLYQKWQFEHKGDEFEVNVKGNLILTAPFMLRNAALSGTGLSYGPEELFREELNSGKLEMVLNNFYTSDAGYFLFFPKTSQVLPKLRAFIDHMKEEMKSK